jgi:hypothetical protein
MPSSSFAWNHFSWAVSRSATILTEAIASWAKSGDGNFFRRSASSSIDVVMVLMFNVLCVLLTLGIAMIALPRTKQRAKAHALLWLTAMASVFFYSILYLYPRIFGTPIWELGPKLLFCGATLAATWLVCGIAGFLYEARFGEWHTRRHERWIAEVEAAKEAEYERRQRSGELPESGVFLVPDPYADEDD